MRNQESNISRLFEGPSYLGLIWIFRRQLYRTDFNSIKPFVAIITSIFIFCSYGISESRETYTNSLGMKFVLIESGIFMMGSLPNEFGRSTGELPQHQVEITSVSLLSVSSQIGVTS